MKPSAFQVTPNPEPYPPGPPIKADPALGERLERIFTGQDPPPLVPIPDEAREMLKQVMAKAPAIVPEEQQRLLEDWALMYHYGGQEILTWKSPQGMAVLAIGRDDVTRAQVSLTYERCFEVLERLPEPW